MLILNEFIYTAVAELVTEHSIVAVASARISIQVSSSYVVSKIVATTDELGGIT